MPQNIGIDFGTTNSCVSYLEGKEAVVIPNPEGSRVIPTIVSRNRDGKKIYGHVAKRQMVTNNLNTIWGVKRLMGRKFDSPEVGELRKRVGFNIVEAENGDVKVRLGDDFYSPQEISGMFFEYLKEIAEDYLGDTVAEAVITVPAFYDDAQRQATKVAGEIAGLKVSRIINEPTAAVVAYRDKIKEDGLYAVYDLGGGTFDISIVEVNGEVYKVVSTLGDTFLGGSDFDARVIEWILGEVNKDLDSEIPADKNTLQRILQNAEKAKIELSFNEEAFISIPYLLRQEDGTNYHFQKKLSRAQLEHETIDLIDQTIDLIRSSLEEINVAPDQINRVILVGGQSRMPLVSQKLTTLFGQEPYVDLNPEEVVAQGAALQSEIIKGRVKDLLLLDVTPLSLGVETKGDKFTQLIEKNSTIPIKRSMVFTTINDNQRTVKIHVVQGEREVASQNKSLGYFNLVGIPLAPKGIPQIEVSFKIDADGIVRVSAKDKQTGLSQSMKVQPASGLSPEEIKRIASEAQLHREKDKAVLRLNEVKEKLKDESESVKFFLRAHKDKLKDAELTQVEKVMKQTTSALEGEDVHLLDNLLNKIQTIRIKINNILISEFEN
jgi:molecular chaperone DnaK